MTGTASDPKHTSSSAKHGGGNVTTASGTAPLVFTDDVTGDDSTMN